MNIRGFLFGCMAAVVGAASIVGVVPEAEAAGGFQTSCTPIGGGMARCTQLYCNDTGCAYVDSWIQPMPEASIDE